MSFNPDQTESAETSNDSDEAGFRRSSRGPAIELATAVLVFAAVFLATLYCFRGWSTTAALFPSIFLASIAVPAARWGRRMFLMTDPRWTLGILVALLFAFAGTAWFYRDYPYGTGFSRIDYIGRLCCLFLPVFCLAFFIAGIVRDMVRMRRRISFVPAPDNAGSKASRSFEIPVVPEKTYLGPLRLTKAEGISLIIAGCILFALRVPMFIPIEIACDEYYHNVFYSPPEDPMKGGADTTYKTNRYSTFLVSWAIDTFVGIPPFGFTLIGLYLGFAGLLAGGIVLSRFWGTSHSVAATTSILLFLGLHPYAQNLMFYRGGTMFFIGLPCVLVPLLTVRRDARTILPGALLIAFGLGLYQAFLNAMAAAYLIYMTLEGVRELRRTRFPSFVRLWNRCRVPETFAVTMLGCVLHLIFARVFASLVGMVYAPGEYTKNYVAMAGFSNPGDRFRYLADLYFQFFAPVDAPFAVPLNIIPIAMTALGVAGIFAIALQRPRSGFGDFRPRRVFFALFLVAILWLGSYFSVLGIMSFIDWSDFPPRIVMMISIFFAGGFALAWIAWGGRPRGRALLLTAASVLFLSYSIFISGLIADSWRISQIDRAKAIRMIYDLEKMPDFKQVRSICFIPMEAWNDTDLSYPVPSSKHKYLESAFAWYHARVELLNAVSGYEFRWPRGVEFEYKEIYSEMPVWPAEGSIIIDGDTAIIRIK